MQVGYIVMLKDGRMDTGTLEAESPEAVERFLLSDPNVDSALALEEIKLSVVNQ